MIRRCSKAVFVQAFLLVLLVAPAAAAAAPVSVSERYVALGDSFSSGAATGDYELDPACERGRYGYPAVVAARRPRLKLDFVACAGATISDALADQVSHLSRTTRWVTVTIGGNDIGLTRVIGACLQPGPPPECRSAIDDTRNTIRDDLPAKLDAVYGEIRTRAPDATVIVLGYPRLFTGESCEAAGSFSPASLAALNDIADLLRDTLRSRVRAAGRGFQFKDAIPAFAGHEICSPRPFLYGLISPVNDSYHPNRIGQRRGYARLVLRAMAAARRPASRAAPRVAGVGAFRRLRLRKAPHPTGRSRRRPLAASARATMPWCHGPSARHCAAEPAAEPSCASRRSSRRRSASSWTSPSARR
jgi:lysophospholipase L1-like esterase